MKSLPAFGYKLFTGSLKDIPLKDKVVVHTINQYSYCVTLKDNEFKHALQQADVLLPDGIGITKAVKFIYKKNIRKIAGADIHAFLLKKLQAENGTCFYLGSSDDTLVEIKKKLEVEFPEIKAGFYSPPFKEIFSEEDDAAMIKAVNEFQPDVLFIGMTAPKQEKWVEEHKDQLHTNIICTIGAVFDFYSGKLKRADEKYISAGLEWFVRFVKEPKRMWKRYFLYGPFFMYKITRLKGDALKRKRLRNRRMNFNI